MSLALEGLARRFPEASAEEVRLRFVALLYGGTLADDVRAVLIARRSGTEGCSIATALRPERRPP